MLGLFHRGLLLCRMVLITIICSNGEGKTVITSLNGFRKMKLYLKDTNAKSCFVFAMDILRFSMYDVSGNNQAGRPEKKAMRELEPTLYYLADCIIQTNHPWLMEREIFDGLQGLANLVMVS